MHRAGIPSSSGADARDDDEGGGHANPREFLTVSEFFFPPQRATEARRRANKKKPVSDGRFFSFCILSFGSYNTRRVSLFLYIYNMNRASDGKLISYTHILYTFIYGWAR